MPFSYSSSASLSSAAPLLQPHGLSCAENVVKECEEEASIPEALALRARPAGAVSYSMLQVGRGTLCPCSLAPPSAAPKHCRLALRLQPEPPALHATTLCALRAT